MSWLFSRVLVGDCWAHWPVDSGQCAPLNMTGTVDAYLCSGKTNESFRPSRYGMTFAPLTEERGEALCKWLLEGSLARRSVQPQGEGEQR